MNRFLFFWLARTFSFYGDYIFATTMTWFALTQGGAMEVAEVTTMLVVFRALGSFLLGPLVNLIGSRKMIVMSDLMRAVFNLLLWVTATSHTAWIWPTLVINAVSAFFAGGFDSGMQSFIPTISTKLREANADLSRGRFTMQLLGYLTGGVLIQWLFGFGFLINALTFIGAAVVTYFVGGGEPTVNANVKVKRNSLSDLASKFALNWKQSWQAMRASHTLRLAFWTTLVINLFITPMVSLVAPLLKATTGSGGMMYSIIQCSSVLGGFIGATWVRKSKFKDAHLMIIGTFSCGLIGLVASEAQFAIFLAGVMFLFGFSSSVYNISESTAIQKSEPHLRASITGIISVSFLFFYPVTSLTAGDLMMKTNIHLPFMIAGGFVILVCLFCGWRWFVAENGGNGKQGNNAQEAEVPL